MTANTIFLRLEGPLQAWGDTSKFVIRRTMGAPTKSGLLGLICCAMGLSRREAADKLLELNSLAMGVRIDRPGVRWWDWHTVGARMKMRTAEGKAKPGALLTKREYLCDASFLVVLQGEPRIIQEILEALKKPKWTLYLGRKGCPPSRPLLEKPSTGDFPDLLSALKCRPWHRRFKEEKAPDALECLLEWNPAPGRQEVPSGVLLWYDVPVGFDPPSHRPRFLVRERLCVGQNGDLWVADEPLQHPVPKPLRPRANYTNSAYRKARESRMAADHGLCVFCKMPARTVQHITYRRAGGEETMEDLRSLCRLCHDAVTMIEYGLNMGLDRIDPEDPAWRERIIEKRREIIKSRSLENRRRRLSTEEVE